MAKSYKIAYLVFAGFFILSFLYGVRSVKASAPGQCSNRFVTIINPVRGRGLWKDHSLKPLVDQHREISNYGFSATWLMTYDALTDDEIIAFFKSNSAEQETGIFLEITRKLANDARVYRSIYHRWSSPAVVFLSSYKPSERKKLIDRMFEEYQENVGNYPKSVGAWWIDSYSLDYMVNKYKVEAVLIVANQLVTDAYGIWGQWWGMPYYPSKANILTPANTPDNLQDVVVVQWAQRDPILAYGGRGEYSLYSMQANDYVRVGKSTDYFEGLVNTHLDCRNSLGQVTVGLETGMESIEAFPEFQNQLEVLAKHEEIMSVTMKQFSGEYKSIYKSNPEKIILGEEGKEWELTPGYRKNRYLGDHIDYQNNKSFSDYFIKDDFVFLDRDLTKLGNRQQLANWVPWYLAVILALGIYSFKKKLLTVWLSGTFWTISSFGLLLRSKEQFGWWVYYGPKVPFLEYVQIFVVTVSYVFIYCLFCFIKKRYRKKVNTLFILMPLAFGLNTLVTYARYSLISGKHHLGFSLDSFRFIGIVYSKLPSIVFVNRDFPSVQASALLRFDYAAIWDNMFLGLVAYPLIFSLVAVVLFLVVERCPRIVKGLIIVTLLILFAVYLKDVISADPRLVVPLI